MANRTRYLVNRVASIARSVASPAGIMSVIAFVAGAGAVYATGGASTTLAIVSLALWLAVILMLGNRMRIVSDRSNRAVHAARESQSTGAQTSSVSKTGQKVERTIPSAESKRIASARAALAMVAPPQPVGGAPSTAVDGSSPGSDPLVSVVVANFNESGLVLHCLASVKSQTYKNWECIIIDDASTDSSLRTVWEFAQTDGRFRVVRHARNGGVSAARNTGLRLAGGEYVLFLDGQNFLTEDSLADRVRHLLPQKNNPAVAGVHCGATRVPDDARATDYRKGQEWSGDPVDFVSSGDRCPFPVHAALTKRWVLEAAGGFDESMRTGGEDRDLWYRIMRNGFLFEPSALRSVICRQGPVSISGRYAIGHVAEAARLVKASEMPADESLFFVGGQAVMSEPRSRYRASAEIARHAVRTFAEVLLSGDEASAVVILDETEPVHPLVLSRHVRPAETVDDGFRTYLGLEALEFSALETEVSPLVQHALDLVASHLVTEEDRAPSVPGVTFDALLLPQTSFQLEQMLEACSESKLSIAVVDSSRAAGDQGVTDLIERLSPMPITVMSNNEAVLKSAQCRLAVVSYPRDAAIDELGLLFVNRGAAVVELRSDLDEILRFDGLPPGRLTSLAVSFGELSDALVAGDLEALTVGYPSDAGVPTFETSTLLYRDVDDAWRLEEYPQHVFDAGELARFKDLHAGERVVIIGNGPSLNELDLSLLEGTATFGVNGIFYADDRLPEPVTYYVVEDTAVVRDNLERVRMYEASHRFFPTIYREMIGESPNSTFFMMNRGFYEDKAPGFCVPHFSTDISQRVYAGQSVTIMNLQLAYYMGFTEVILIGMDFSYTVPESSQVDGILITSMGDDPNHFHPDYFGKGKVWKDPKLDRVLANYALAKQMYEADGRRIINATPGGNLHLFDRVPFQEAMQS